MISQVVLLLLLLLFFVFVFSRAVPAAYGVPRLGVELELQLPACPRATAARDLSHVCDLHHNSQQCQILNPLSKARDGTHNLMVLSQIN